MGLGLGEDDGATASVATGDGAGAGVDDSGLGVTTGEGDSWGRPVGVEGNLAGGAGGLEDGGAGTAWVCGTSPLYTVVVDTG